MSDLREEIEACVRGRSCLVGVGNTDSGDDALGVRLAESLRAAAGIGDGGGDAPEIIAAGPAPERFLPHLADGGYDTVLFLDAVDFGGAPGSVVLLDSMQMAERFPQISTHRVSLGTLACAIEADGKTRVWLLGVQPNSLVGEASLTSAVQQTVDMLVKLFVAALARTQTDPVRV
ncbi:MAG TPA: hydrogenase maturation protease [Verrucomicrobiae bacterium]|nr:hydrogenase maturation protease [Verrucomicrobiae bacterium]